jgi:hypothetical protein
MRRLNLRHVAASAAILVASSVSAMAGGWGYGGGCGCGGCGCAAPAVSTVAVMSYTPVTTYQAYTVYRPVTSYVPSVSYQSVPYEQAYVVDQGPRYVPAATGYRTASYTYDEPRRHRYIDGADYGYRDYGYRARYRYGARYRHDAWRGYDRWQRRDFHFRYRHPAMHHHYRGAQRFVHRSLAGGPRVHWNVRRHHGPKSIGYK